MKINLLKRLQNTSDKTPQDTVRHRVETAVHSSSILRSLEALDRAPLCGEQRVEGHGENNMG